MKEHLGKFEAAGLAFAKEALEAAGIEYVVRDDIPQSIYSMTQGRMTGAPARFDVLVDSERLADAKVIIDRWQEEAEDAARRESGAPPPTAEDLAADAEWEKQKAAGNFERAPVWLGRVLLAGFGTLIAYLLLGR